MRRSRAKAIGNLDPLLNTLTNVVGILVILLPLTQLGVGEAVKRIHSSLVETSGEKFEELQAQAEDLQRRLDEDGPKSVAADKQEQVDSAAIVTVELLTRDVQAAVAKLPEHYAKAQEAQQAIAERSRRLAELEQELARNEEELARVTQELEQAPEPAAEVAAKVVRLPNPREVPEGWTEHVFACRYGRIMRLDDGTLLKRAQDTIARGTGGRRTLRLNLGRNNRKVLTVDCAALSELFEEKQVGNGYFRISVGVLDEVPALVYAVRPSAGESVEDIADTNSSFRQVVRRLNRRGEYVRFLVWPDSFDIYLAAREQTDELGVSAGWELRDDGAEYRRPLVDTRGDQVFCKDYDPPREPPQSALAAVDKEVAGRKVPPDDVLD